MEGVGEVEYIVTTEGKRKAVVIPWEEYEQLLEDMYDLRIIAERKEEKGITLSELKKRLKKDELLP